MTDQEESELLTHLMARGATSVCELQNKYVSLPLPPAVFPAWIARFEAVYRRLAPANENSQ